MPQERSVRGPFRPGSGSPPPYLAGREAEQTLLRDLLVDLGNGIPPPADVVLHGPRGNGKTVLLAWLEEEAASRPNLDVVFLDPSMCRTKKALARRLLAKSWWKRLSPAELTVKGLTWRPGEGPAPSPDEVLTARASRRPLLLVLDEAHTLAPEVGNSLLNASQAVRRRFPLLFVLAGTPELQERLGAMEASFWGRCRPVPIGRLPEEDAGEAIHRPLAERGIPIDESALDRIVEQSHGYPFFLQLWGDAVWQQVSERDDGHGVTEGVVEAAEKDFEFRKDSYYRQRYNELRKVGLLTVARAVAEAFVEETLLDDLALEAAVKRGAGPAASPEDLAEAENALFRFGYIWQPAAETRWEPGIPSLMDFIRERVPAPQ